MQEVNAVHLCFNMLVAHCTNLSLCLEVQNQTFFRPSMSLRASSMSLHRHMEQRIGRVCEAGGGAWGNMGGGGLEERVGQGEGKVQG